MRKIFIVNATQVVVSESHPEGLFSVVSGYPKTFDSRNYNATEHNPDGSAENALKAAKAEWHSRVSANYVGSPSRAMATVTLESEDGFQILNEKIGDFPNVTPEPEELVEPEAE